MLLLLPATLACLLAALGPVDASLTQTMPHLPDQSHQTGRVVMRLVSSSASLQPQDTSQAPPPPHLLNEVFPTGIPSPNPSLPDIPVNRPIYYSPGLDSLMSPSKIPRTSPGSEITLSSSKRFAHLRDSKAHFQFDGIMNVLERPWYYPFCVKRPSGYSPPSLNGDLAGTDIKAYECYLGDRRREWGWELSEMTTGRWNINSAFDLPWRIRTESPSRYDDKSDYWDAQQRLTKPASSATFWDVAWKNAEMESASTCTHSQRGKFVVRAKGMAHRKSETSHHVALVYREVMVIADC